MRKRITIVDYGLGNLYSVRRALEVSGATDVTVSDREEDLLNADKIILPGVGAFEDGMRGLRERGLIQPLIKTALEGKSILGICLGMQLLATTSEEFGIHEGLSLIPGKVHGIPNFSVDGQRLKVPFVGWSKLILNSCQFLDQSCLAHTEGVPVYFVHSFHFLPLNPNHRLASYEYGDHQISAVVGHGNILGVQFHPEKSGSVGLSFLKRFVEL